tara:strand:- start:480 stop:704 length:225 start_codon:yes stop_codon:yes gene_type:complete
MWLFQGVVLFALLLPRWMKDIMPAWIASIKLRGWVEAPVNTVVSRCIPLNMRDWYAPIAESIPILSNEENVCSF